MESYDNFEEAKPIVWQQYFKNQELPKEKVKVFTDPYFPHDSKTLISNNYPIEFKDLIEKEIKTADIEWKRPKEFLKQGYQLFQNKIDISNIKQGSISNCYFLSSIAALTEFPELIYQKFITKEENEFGYYEIVLFIDGEWQVVFVDDYIPCYIGTTNPYFAKPSDVEIWPLLLEKAWAKVNGGYSNIVLGEVGAPLKALTGCSVQYFNIDNFSYTDLWDKINSSDKQNYVACTCTKDEDFVEKYGLVKGHAYTLISANEIYYEERAIKLLKLFNPWGKKEWNGDWSDNSFLWDDKLTEHFGKVSADDGSFFMAVEDYQNYYHSIYIGYLLYGSHMTSFKINENLVKKPIYFLLDLPKSSNVAISLLFKHWRYNRELRNKKRSFSIVVAKLDNQNQIENVFGEHSDGRDVEIYKQLDEGRYIIWVCNLTPDEDNNNPYIFRAGSVGEYNIKYYGEDTNYELLQHIFISHRQKVILAESKKKTFAFEADIVLKYAGLQAFVGINNSDKYVKLIQKSIDQNQGFRILYRPPNYDLNLGPGDSFCYIAGSVQNLNFNFKASLKKGEVVEEVSNATYNKSKIIQLLNTPSNDTSEIFTNIFPTLNQLKYERTFTDLISRRERKEFTMEDFRELNSFAYKELFKILPKVNDKLIYKKEFNGVYFGQNQVGDYIGAKLFKNKDQDIYIGYWNSNNKFNGEGIIYSVERGIVTYEGEFKNGLKHGIGRWITDTGEEYFCEFSNGEATGIGKLFIPSINIIYYGELLSGKKHGSGLELNISTNKVYKIKYDKGFYIESEEINKDILDAFLKIDRKLEDKLRMIPRALEKIQEELNKDSKLSELNKLILTQDQIASELKSVGDFNFRSNIKKIESLLEKVNSAKDPRNYKPSEYTSDKLSELRKSLPFLSQRITELKSHSKFCFDILSEFVYTKLIGPKILFQETNYGFKMRLVPPDPLRDHNFMMYLKNYDLYILYSKFENTPYYVVFDSSYNILYEGQASSNEWSRYHSLTGEYIEHSPKYNSYIRYINEYGTIKCEYNKQSLLPDGKALYVCQSNNKCYELCIKEGVVNTANDSDCNFEENLKITIEQLEYEKLQLSNYFNLRELMLNEPIYHLFSKTQIEESNNDAPLMSYEFLPSKKIKKKNILIVVPGKELEFKSLPKRRRTVSRPYGGSLSAEAVKHRILRSFFNEEMKVLKQHATSSKKGKKKATTGQRKK